MGQGDRLHLTAAEPLHANKVLNRIGFGRYQVLLFLGCGLAWAIDNMQIGLMPIMMCELEPEYGKVGVSSLAGSLFLGTAVGAMTWGALSDRKGRLYGITGSLVMCAIGVILVVSLPGLLWLQCGCYFIVGFGIGGNVPVAGTLFTESVPEEKRTLGMVILTFTWSVGLLFAAVISYLLLHDEWTGKWGMRYVQATVLIPLLAAVPMFILTINESPLWYSKTNRISGAVRVLKRIAKRNGMSDGDIVQMLGVYHNADRPAKDHSMESVEMVEVPGVSSVSFIGNDQGVAANDPGSGAIEGNGLPSNNGQAPRNDILDTLGAWESLSLIFGRDRWLVSTVLIFLWMSFSLGYAMFVMLIPSNFERLRPGSNPADKCNLTVGMLGSLASVPAYLFAVPFLRIFGQKYTFTATVVGAAVCEVIFYFGKNDAVKYLAAATYAILTTLSWAALYAITSNSYPTIVRNSAFGLCSSTNRVAAISTPFLGTLLPSWVPIPVIVVCGAASVLLRIPDPSTDPLAVAVSDRLSRRHTMTRSASGNGPLQDVPWERMID